jgi:hypothetical protein
MLHCLFLKLLMQLISQLYFGHSESFTPKSWIFWNLYEAERKNFTDHRQGLMKINCVCISYPLICFVLRCGCVFLSFQAGSHTSQSLLSSLKTRTSVKKLRSRFLTTTIRSHVTVYRESKRNALCAGHVCPYLVSEPKELERIFFNSPLETLTERCREIPTFSNINP